MSERDQGSEQEQMGETGMPSINARMGFLIALAVAFSFAYASFHPHQLVLPAASNVLVAFAIGAAALAMVRLQPPIAPYLTFWDKSAVLMLFATGALLVHQLPGLQAYFETLPPLETATTVIEAPADGAVSVPAAAEPAADDAAASPEPAKSTEPDKQATAPAGLPPTI